MAEGAPRSAGSLALITALVVIGGFLLLRLLFNTIGLLINVLLVAAILVSAGYLYARYRSRP